MLLFCLQIPIILAFDYMLTYIFFYCLTEVLCVEAVLLNTHWLHRHFWHGCYFAKASRSKCGNPDKWSQFLNVPLCLHCNWCKIVISSYFLFTRPYLDTEGNFSFSQLLLRHVMYLFIIIYYLYQIIRVPLFFPWIAPCPYKTFQRIYNDIMSS